MSQRRFQSSNILSTYDTVRKTRTIKNNWLSDISTYPVMAALGFALAMAGGFGISFLVNSPDVRLSGHKKQSTVRDW
jgi:hypothetical protein